MYNIKGTVISGRKMGRELGFPTANVKAKQNYEPGVYAGQVVVGSKVYNSAIFLAKESLAEAYIFDFQGDLYGKEIEIRAQKLIRKPIKFESEEALKIQITKDVEMIKNLLE